jgi:hemerythrin
MEHRSCPSGKTIGHHKFKLGEHIVSITNQEISGRTQKQDQSINQLIQWGDHLSVGHPEIDAQHKEIYEFGAEIYESWRHGVRVGELRLAADKLLKLLRAHFVYEERLLAGIGYADLKQHVAEHRSMLKELQDMREHFETLGDDDDSPGGSVLSPNWSVMRFILGFSLGHVMTSDMSYSQPLMASRKAAKPPEGGA